MILGTTQCKLASEQKASSALIARSDMRAHLQLSQGSIYLLPPRPDLHCSLVVLVHQSALQLRVKLELKEEEYHFLVDKTAALCFW